MKRFPEDAKDGEPFALVPESDDEWQGIETDISRREVVRRVAPVLAASALVTAALIIYAFGWPAWLAMP